MKKTKIICSIGPASSSVDIMEQLVNNGMNVARINFSHATLEEKETVIGTIKEVRKRTGKTIAILYDTKGPDFRTGMLKTEFINLIEGNTITITKDNILGTPKRITVNYKDVLDDIPIGNKILLEDGLLELKVIEKTKNNDLVCKIINGGKLGHKKGINVPGIKLNIPFLSEQDIQDIRYACQNEGDFIAVSFVEDKAGLLQVKQILAEENRSDMQVISKVESSVAIENIDEIIEHSEGIMVARGDLGVEVPVYEVPFLQKMIIKKCRKMCKFVIVATEMLASMTEKARPTRAEATDIATAVLDGTDAVMLSGETTTGKHPVQAVKYMSEIVENAEKHFEYQPNYNKDSSLSITEVIAKTVVKSVFKLDAKLIIIPVFSGYSARIISNLVPLCPILAICPNEGVARQLILNHGVYPVVHNKKHCFHNIMENAKKEAVAFANLKPKDIIIIAGGFSKDTSFTNLMKIEEI